MDIPVFDAHCDTIVEAARSGVALRRNALQLDLERGMRFLPYAQVFAIFDRPWPEDFDWHNVDYSRDWPPETLVPVCDRLLDALLSEFANNSDLLVHCKSAGDAKAVAQKGKIAAFIAIEGAELIGCDLKLLQRVYDKGVRLINLCWNYDNALCGSAMSSGSGLTQRGREFVIKMQELGLSVDLSHASERTFWDVAEIAARPVIAGHSNSKTVCNHPRNLTDDQFKELVRRKGVAGINLCPDFLSTSGTAAIDDIVRHIDHFMELGGEKAVCLGGDLDGIDEMPKGISGIQDYDKIYKALQRRGYSRALLRDIFYNNLLNVLERVL